MAELLGAPEEAALFRGRHVLHRVSGAARLPPGARAGRGPGQARAPRRRHAVPGQQPRRALRAQAVRQERARGDRAELAASAPRRPSWSAPSASAASASATTRASRPIAAPRPARSTTRSAVPRLRAAARLAVSIWGPRRSCCSGQSIASSSRSRRGRTCAWDSPCFARARTSRATRRAAPRRRRERHAMSGAESRPQPLRVPVTDVTVRRSIVGGQRAEPRGRQSGAGRGAARRSLHLRSGAAAADHPLASARCRADQLARAADRPCARAARAATSRARAEPAAVARAPSAQATLRPPTLARHDASPPTCARARRSRVLRPRSSWTTTSSRASRGRSTTRRTTASCSTCRSRRPLRPRRSGVPPAATRPPHRLARSSRLEALPAERGAAARRCARRSRALRAERTAERPSDPIEELELDPDVRPISGEPGRLPSPPPPPPPARPSIPEPPDLEHADAHGARAGAASHQAAQPRLVGAVLRRRLPAHGARADPSADRQAVRLHREAARAQARCHVARRRLRPRSARGGADRARLRERGRSTSRWRCCRAPPKKRRRAACASTSCTRTCAT